ncbi:hypothetical protein [Tropicimonas sediminicola]|nr:hypothetical protein [Tropicimonas sediminicola]
MSAVTWSTRVVVVGTVSMFAAVASSQQARELGEELFFDLSTGFLANDNYERLETPSGDTYLWVSDVTLGYSSETDVSSFDASIGGRLQLGEFGEDPDENGGFINPFLSLAYGRDGVASDFTTSLLLRETDNGLDITEIENSTDLIIDQGTRRDLKFAAGLSLGKDAPVSFEGDLAYAERRFLDSDDPDLTDQDTVAVSAELGFALTRTARLLVTGAYKDRDDIDDIKNDETNSSFGIGLLAEIDPTLTFRGTLSHSINETTRTRDGERVTDTEERPTIDLALFQDRNNGTNRVSLSSELDGGGYRTTLSAGREMELRDGLLDFSLGVTRTESGHTNPVGSLEWTRQNRDSVFSLSFNNGVQTDDDDNEVLFSRLSATFLQEVTAVSGFRVSVGTSASEGLDDDTDDRRYASAGLSYFHDLDRDWSFVAGYIHEYSVDGGDDTMTSNQIFATIDRRFSLRP